MLDRKAINTGCPLNGARFRFVNGGEGRFRGRDFRIRPMARLYNRRRVPVRFRGGGKTALPGAAEKANVTNEETRRTRSRSNMV